MMIMNVNFNWYDVVNLIQGPGGLKYRRGLNLSYSERNILPTEWGEGGHFAWRGENYKLIVLSDKENQSLLGLFTDIDKPADEKAKNTWDTVKTFFESYQIKQEPETL